MDGVEGDEAKFGGLVGPAVSGFGAGEDHGAAAQPGLPMVVWLSDCWAWAVAWSGSSLTRCASPRCMSSS